MQRGFTLLEICIAIFIAMLVVTMAVPSLTSVLEGRKQDERYEAFNQFVQEGRLRSITERRPWVIEWQSESLLLRPIERGGDAEDTEEFSFEEDESFDIRFPAALMDQPTKLWTFWPSGNCEAAVVSYSAKGVRWDADYHPLTGQAEVTYPEKKR